MARWDVKTKNGRIDRSALSFAQALTAIIKQRKARGEPGPDWKFNRPLPSGPLLEAMRKDRDAALSVALGFTPTEE